MQELIFNIVSKIINFLPSDPLSNYLQSTSISIINSNWLHWLNWLFPVHDIFVIFSLWLSALIIYKVIKLFIDGFSSFGGNLL